MTTIFEIFNKSGDLIRRGVVKEDGLNIDIQEDDYRYIVRDKDDPMIIYSQGYLQSKKKKTRRKGSPIVLVDQISNKVNLHCNMFKSGHKTIVYYLADNPNKRNELDIEKPSIELDMSPGRYVLFTSNEKEESEKVFITVSDDSQLDFLDKVSENIRPFTDSHQEAKGLIEDIIKSEDGGSLYETAQQVYLNTDDSDLSLSAYDIIFEVEKIINERNQLLNEHTISHTAISMSPQDIMKTDSAITKIAIYEISGDSYMFSHSVKKNDDSEYTILTKPNTPYKIDIYCESDIVNTFFVFSPSEQTRKDLWDRQRDSLEITQEAKDRHFLLFNGYVDYSEKIKEIMSIKESKKPSHDIVSSPEAVYRDNCLEISISDYEMLKRLEKDLYVCIKEDRYVFFPNKSNRILAESELMEIDIIECRIFPEINYLVWIEDSDGNVLSESTLISTDCEAADEYNLASREISIQSYEDRLLSYATQKYEGVAEPLRNELSQLVTVDEVSPRDIYKSLTARLSKSKNKGIFNAIAELIIIEKFNNILIDEQFFSGPVLFNSNLKRLVFPDRYYEYIIQVDSFNVGDSFARTEYYNIKDKGIVNLKDDDYFIISAIDKSTYKRSGFLFLNTFKNDSIMSNWKLGIEVR